MSVVIAEHLTLDQWLDLNFPNPGPADLIRFEAESRTDYRDLDYFFTRRGGRWHWPPDARVGADDPAQCLARNSDAKMGLSPLIYENSPMRGAPRSLSRPSAISGHVIARPP